MSRTFYYYPGGLINSAPLHKTASLFPSKGDLTVRETIEVSARLRNVGSIEEASEDTEKVWNMNVPPPTSGFVAQAASVVAAMLHTSSFAATLRVLVKSADV